ncbi:glycosyltransferase [Pseudodesulfovibrio tunisiensis]|uniref:glycosyltransferase family protein n=1 Tax=Pseudodesulfovibrio tunisiensis TaxID=463192 RepID=UPI001FB2D854|nr:glycosyltransferase [Pseudodesulfovibrio tunisiensis]
MIERIVWVGGIYFHHHLAAHGLSVTHIPFESPGLMDWNELVTRTGFEPDMVVYADRSLPPPLAGIERFPCLTAFYAVDSHIHEWYPLYAQGFDMAFVSLRDHLPRFRQRLKADQVVWLPPWPLRNETRPDPRPEPEWDLLFAGKVDPETTPERHAFLHELGELFPGLTVRHGNFQELFPRARIVLNIAERGDLNFRVFEALACGSCLLTPAIGNGQADLFANGVHLATYEPGNASDAARIARELLADPEKRERMALAGFQEVDQKHRPQNRAATFAETIAAADAASLVRDRLTRSRDIHARYLRLVHLHWAKALGDTGLGRQHLAAARAARH